MWNDFMRLYVCRRIKEKGRNFGEGTNEDWKENAFI